MGRGRSGWQRLGGGGPDSREPLRRPWLPREWGRLGRQSQRSEGREVKGGWSGSDEGSRINGKGWLWGKGSRK